MVRLKVDPFLMKSMDDTYQLSRCLSKTNCHVCNGVMNKGELRICNTSKQSRRYAHVDCFEYSVDGGVVGEFVNDQLNLGGVVDRDKPDELQKIVDLINKPRRVVVEKADRSRPAKKRKAVSGDEKRTFYELGEYEPHSDNKDLRDQLVKLSDIHNDIGKSARSLGGNERFAKLHIAMGQMIKNGGADVEKFPHQLDMSSIKQFPIHKGRGLLQIMGYVATGELSDIEKMKNFKAALESEGDDNSGSGAVHDGNGDEDGEEKDEDQAEENGDEDVVDWPRGS